MKRSAAGSVARTPAVSSAGDDVLTLLDASTGLARSVVAKWMKTDTATVSAAAPATTTPSTSKAEAMRPARVGLGAEFLSHAQAQRVNEAVLSKKIRASAKRGLETDAKDGQDEEDATPAKKKAAKVAEPDDLDEEDEDEEDSRTHAVLKSQPKQPAAPAATMGKKANPGKRKRKQLKRQQSPEAQPVNEAGRGGHPAKSEPEEEETFWQSNWDGGAEEPEDDIEDVADEESSRLRTQKLELNQPLVPKPPQYKERVEVIDGKEVIIKRKKTKKRSKQKNLRKDTRPPELKPTYRTPGAPDYKAPKPAFPHKVVVNAQEPQKQKN